MRNMDYTDTQKFAEEVAYLRREGVEETSISVYTEIMHGFDIFGNDKDLTGANARLV